MDWQSKLTAMANSTAQTRPEWARAWRSANGNRDRLRDALVFMAYRLAGPSLHYGPSHNVVARWILGERPEQIAPGLTKREAAQWITQSVDCNPIAWLWRTCSAVPDNCAAPHTMAVCRWAIAALRDPKRRSAIRAHIHELDEVLDEDLIAGGLSIPRVFARAARRASGWDGVEELMPLQSWESRLPGGVTLLRTASQIASEGAAMCHCVAKSSTYFNRIQQGTSWIFSIDSDGRSTVEIACVNRAVLQHRGIRNSDPPAQHNAIAAALRRVLP